jgi:glycine/D-amino acid oxidase-like deaminating enzyme
MDLKTGNLLWPTLSAETPRFPRLEKDLKCEVAVIGGGITGAMLAAALADEGVDTIVVDRRQPAEGSTAACSALVLYEIDVPLIELVRQVGHEHARRAYAATRRALDDLQKLIEHFEIACDLQRLGSLYLAREACDMSWFADEVAARRSVGIEVELCNEPELEKRFHLRRPGAIHSAVAMEVDPYRLTLGLIDAAVQRGARVFGDTNVQLNHPILQADDGPRIKCDHVIIATGYETPEQFHKIRGLCSLKSTYCLASQSLPGETPWPEPMLFWEASEPYLYARLDAERVILGGEDEPIVDATRRDALIEAKTERLLEKFAQLYPDIDLTPKFVWAGTFAETRDGLPYIGCPSESPGYHFALGYGGNGITWSVLASQILRDAIAGRRNSDADLFRFDR